MSLLSFSSFFVSDEIVNTFSFNSTFTSSFFTPGMAASTTKEFSVSLTFTAGTVVSAFLSTAGKLKKSLPIMEYGP